ncbi:hypothetical protein AAFC00_002526 [Neodothiora populina]|uniref:L-serine ammonia-lyase n=1 Tax=Neodothiora populina TaxID=2781224 RepID=A0ABR3P7U2_9PEZI
MTLTKPWVETPLVESATLSKAAGCRIFLKMETLQPSKSFKSRGVGNLILQSLAKSPCPDRTHFYSSSGGNAGLACVHAARSLGRPASVVVPMSTKELMIAKLRAAGATEVVQFGATWREADAFLRMEVLVKARAKGEDAVYVPPFDHPDIWAGNSTLMDELALQMEDVRGPDDASSAPDVLICSVGGGGLFNGIVDGIDRCGGEWDRTLLLAVETRGAESLAKSMSSREHITLPGITSIATSLGCTKVSDRTYELATTRKQVRSVVLSDEEAAMGCWRLADDENVIVEPACGVNVALCYGGRLKRALGRPVRGDDKVVIVLCGGSAITVDQLAQFKEEFGYLGDELSQSDKAGVASAVTNGSKH